LERLTNDQKINIGRKKMSIKGLNLLKNLQMTKEQMHLVKKQALEP
jgi:hypothetical protein